MRITDRLEFLRRISTDNKIELICKYFDQNMALYNIIYNNIDSVNISQSLDEYGNVVFFIRFNDIDIDNAISIKDNDKIFCYGRYYLTKLFRLSDTLINLTFIEVAS